MTNYFEKCQKCVPPERHPGCQDHCPYYAESRAKWDADKAKIEADKELRYYLIQRGLQTNDNLVKYIKKRPKHKKIK